MSIYRMRHLGVLLLISIGLLCCRPTAVHQESCVTHCESTLRLAVTSATHIGFLSELDELDCVVAVCNKQQIYTPLPDSVMDLGDATSPNLEALVLAHVDAVLVCSYAGSQLESQLARLGIRAIPINEWQETTPLARTAWIKQLGRELGCEAKADSIYRAIETRYCHLVQTQASVVPTRIMTGSNYRGTWYVPSGQSFMGQLFHDAGFVYPYDNDTRSGSIPLTLEACLLQFREADVWVGSDARTLSELRAMDDKHTWFRAYQTNHVYNWLRQSTSTGANNFWERGVVHPEEILEDLIHIRLHQDDSLHYALHLENGEL